MLNEGGETMPTTNSQEPKQPGAGIDYAQRMRLKRAKETARQMPSVGAMVAKIVIGVLLIVVGIISGNDGFDPKVFLIGLILGLGLIAWGIVGYRQQVKKIEDARLELVLSTPLEEMENSELSALAEKYDDAEKTEEKS